MFQIYLKSPGVIELEKWSLLWIMANIVWAHSGLTTKNKFNQLKNEN